MPQWVPHALLTSDCHLLSRAWPSVSSVSVMSPGKYRILALVLMLSRKGTETSEYTPQSPTARAALLAPEQQTAPAVSQHHRQPIDQTSESLLKRHAPSQGTPELHLVRMQLERSYMGTTARGTEPFRSRSNGWFQSPSS